MIEVCECPERLGVCYDTAHAFAAGYDIRTPETYRTTFLEFDRIIGLERLRAFHMNDTKKAFQSRVDRHDHIGQGNLGLEAFRMLVNDRRFVQHPMVLETPKSPDMHEDVMNLTTLRGLLKKRK
jgi:deoxyribonuclease-4